MKQLLYTLAFFLCIFFAGCESDNNYDTGIVDIGIESSNVAFSAAGGAGKITLKAPKTVLSAKSDQAWCTVSATTNVVTVTTTPNLNINGRTALVTLISEDGTQSIPVTQNGVSIKAEVTEATVSGRGDEIRLVIDCAIDFSISIKEEDNWVSGRISGRDTLVLTVPKNPSYLKSRSAKVTLTAGDDIMSIAFPVTQTPYLLLYEDYLGEWVFKYSKTQSDITLEVYEEGVSYFVSGLYFNFLFLYDEPSGTIQLQSQNIGKAGNNTVCIALWEVTGEGNLAWGAGPGLVSEWNENGINFVDSGKWTDYTARGFILWMLNAKGESAGEFKGGPSRFTDLSMTRK